MSNEATDQEIIDRLQESFPNARIWIDPTIYNPGVTSFLNLLKAAQEHIDFCIMGNEPSLLTTDPELATAVHEITGHTTWSVPSDNVEKLIDILPGKKFLVDGDEDLLNSMEQQYPDRIIATVPAKAEKLRERRDEFREWVGSTSDQVNWRK